MQTTSPISPLLKYSVLLSCIEGIPNLSNASSRTPKQLRLLERIAKSEYFTGRMILSFLSQIVSFSLTHDEIFAAMSDAKIFLLSSAFVSFLRR